MDEFEKEYESRKWAIGTGLWRDYRKEYALKKSAFLELKSILDRIGEKQFLYLISTSILTNTATTDPLTLLEENSTVKEKYEKEVSEFNKRFLSTNLHEITLQSTIKYLSNSLATDNISKDFIDTIKSKNGLWESIKSKFTTVLQENNKAWYDVELEPESISNEMKEADNLSLTCNFESAIEVYETLLMNRMDELDSSIIVNIYYKIILSALCIPHITAAKTRLQMGENYRFFKNSKEYHFLHKLLFHIQLHDLNGFVSLVNNTKTDFWSSTMLLRIKNEIYF